MLKEAAYADGYYAALYKFAILAPDVEAFRRAKGLDEPTAKAQWAKMWEGPETHEARARRIGSFADAASAKLTARPTLVDRPVRVPIPYTPQKPLTPAEEAERFERINSAANKIKADIAARRGVPAKNLGPVPGQSAASALGRLSGGTNPTVARAVPPTPLSPARHLGPVPQMPGPKPSALLKPTAVLAPGAALGRR